MGCLQSKNVADSKKIDYKMERTELESADLV